MNNTEQIQAVLRDPAASDWLRRALLQAVNRDPVDAANDAELLARLLSDRSTAVLTGKVKL